MLVGIILAALFYVLVFVSLWSHARFTGRRRSDGRPVVLRPITIPARYGRHEFTDAEIIDRFLAVDWLLSRPDTDALPGRREW